MSANTHSLCSAWTQENRHNLEAWLDELSREGSTPTRRRISLWDWDNTVVHGDVGDLLMGRLLTDNLLIKPHGASWRTVDEYLSHEADTALQQVDPTPSDERTSQTRHNRALCREWLSIYFKGRTTGGEDAFTIPTSRTYEPRYALLPKLCAGHSLHRLLKQCKDFIAQALEQATDTWLVEPDEDQPCIPAWIRFQRPIVELMNHLHQAGAEVWIVTASPLWLVEAASTFLALPPHRVLGIRNTLTDDDRLTSSLEDLSLWAKREEPVHTPPVLCFDEGKPAWVQAALQRDQTHDPRAAQVVFAAGDSETDLPLLQRSTGRKLWLKRKDSLRMDHALAANPAGFLVQPRFLTND